MESGSKYEADGLMSTSTLKKFAQEARRQLREQVCSKLELVLKEGSLARRERASSVENLDEAISCTSKENVIDRVAYIWFNILCALRFMDVNHYTKIRAVSSGEGFTQPEILAEAKQGHVDDSLEKFINKKKVLGILSGSEPSKYPEQEAYRMLLVATCNYYNHIMPFLFQKIDDYSELLMPADLLSESSILTSVRKAMTDDACQNVEVIGWLYQFYISERKDEVFAELKKNKKITPEKIPAATQLFTPHWIVRYLVENSLGRLWMLNNPKSKLVAKMEYYIKPEEMELDFLKISKPEEIKVCDPACGSGHMLTYAFDLLYAIYEEEGYETNEIPQLILENNLFGIEIDERAGELAAFALTMKAREKYKRFFSKAIQPNICVLENIQFDEDNLKEYMDFIGRDLFTSSLQTTLRQFEEADNFGSLIRPDLTDVAGILGILQDKDVTGQLFLNATHQKVLQVLHQVDYLSPKYHVVIANPPYMGGKGMNGRLGAWVKDNYPDSKSDLFAMFIERNLDLSMKQGSVAMITMQSWMFLSSFTKLRENILYNNALVSMTHLGAHAFDSIGGEVVQTTSFVLERKQCLGRKGNYLRLVEGVNETSKQRNFKENRVTGALKFGVSAKDFGKIPGTPIAYWLSPKVFKVFQENDSLGSHCESGGRIKTHDNDNYMRFLWEVDYKAINSENAHWNLYENGGETFKWYGNVINVVSWRPESRARYQSHGGLTNERFWKKEGITWNNIGKSGFRYKSLKTEFSSVSPTAFPKISEKLNFILGFLNTKFSFEIISIINPSLSNTIGDIFKLPFIAEIHSLNRVCKIVKSCIAISISNWDSYETSWDFACHPLLQTNYQHPLLKASYQKLRTHWQEMAQEMKCMEEENNQIFIDAYGLQDELKPEVPLSEITLTWNPHYRYGGDKSESELEALLLADTMREFISYAVGCMVGRYSLDKPGLILANQGETIVDYHKQIPESSFEADEDNVIPFLDKGYFSDDVTERFYKFLKVTFGEEHFDENLKFMEKAIGKNVRKYFLKDFYADHIKRYKKRPIYWMFSSPKGTFSTLIYMHRYRSDTVSIVLNDYLREFRTKLTARRDHLDNVKVDGSANQREQTQAVKELETIKKQIEELNDYEHDILYPLATQKIIIDLDQGVKVNYPKFGKALQKVAGLSDVKKGAKHHE
jgi:type II restriction/modification system DNA methylase subunit YeeA